MKPPALISRDDVLTLSLPSPRRNRGRLHRGAAPEHVIPEHELTSYSPPGLHCRVRSPDLRPVNDIDSFYANKIGFLTLTVLVEVRKYF